MMADESFRRLVITDFFHSFPHYNFDFYRVNSTFSPKVQSYREALILWATTPLLVCVLFWILFGIYFSIRCCQRTKSSRSTGSACPKILTGITIFITVCLLGAGFYENEQAHDGVNQFRQAVSNINSTMDSASDRINLLDGIARDVSTRLYHNLAQLIEESKIPDPEKTKLMGYVNDIMEQAKDVQTFLNDIKIHKSEHEVEDFLEISNDVEYNRWLATIIVFCVFILILLTALIGLVSRLSAVLICSTCLSVFFSLLLWTSCGVYLGSSVALGDFCSDPDAYVMSLSDSQEQRNIVKAYVKCTDPHQPFWSDIVPAMNAIESGLQALNKTVEKAKPYNLTGLGIIVEEMNEDLENSLGNLSSLLQDVGTCAYLHQQYTDALNGSCDTAFSAAALLTLFSLLIALCCVILIFASSCVWRQYKKHRHPQAYEPVDDTDPFLPHPPPYEADYGATRFSSPTPWSERAALQANTSPSLRSDEGVMMLPRHHHPIPMDESPPPAYYPGRFAQK